MSIEIPCLKDLSGLRLEKDVEARYWKVCVTRRDDLYWCIVLSLLVPTAHDGGEDGIFQNIVEVIRGQDAQDASNLKRSTKSYNPFLNREACFYNEELKALTASLVKRVSQETDAFFSRQANSKEAKLQAISRLLKCRITLISENTLDDAVFSSYGSSAENAEAEDFHIILFVKTSERYNKWEEVSYGLRESVGSVMQKNAFKKIMSMAGLFREAESTMKLPGAKENFLSALLKKKRIATLQKLLDHPNFVLFKLQQAGFVTSPTEQDTESLPWNTAPAHSEKTFHPSVFFYAVETGDLRLLYSLHGYSLYGGSATLSSRTESSARDPDPVVVSNLMNVSKILSQTKDFYDNSSYNSQNIYSSIHVTELLKLHEFQTEVAQELIKSESTLNYYLNVSDKVFKAEKCKNFVLRTLELYGVYFYMKMHSPPDRYSFPFETYDSYVKFNHFFRNLDFAAALSIFDHSFALKVQLKLNNGVHERFETRFLRFMFLTRHYDSLRENRRRSRPELGEEFSSTSKHSANYEKRIELLRMLAHRERVKFYANVEKFKRVLRETVVNEENVRDSLPEHEVLTLLSEPEIKDEFVILRLKRHLNLAIRLDLENDFPVGHLVIQRALHVLGECMKLKTAETPTAIKSLLISSLAENKSKDLCKLRDILCHPCPSHLTTCRDLKQEKELYAGVQDDIKVIADFLQHIFELQTLKSEEYVIRMALQNLREWRRSLAKSDDRAGGRVERQLDDLLDNSGESDDEIREENIRDHHVGQNRQSKDSRQRKRKEYWKPSFDSVQRRLIYTRLKMKTKLLKLASVIRIHLENHFSFIRRLQEKLSDEESREKINYLFLSVNVLIKFFVSKTFYKAEKMGILKELRKISKLAKFTEGESVEEHSVNIRNILKKYDDFLNMLFERMVGGKDAKMSRKGSDGLKIYHVRDLKDVLEGRRVLSEETRKEILSLAPENYARHSETKGKLVSSLETEEYLSEETLDELLGHLLFNAKKIKSLKTAYNKRDLETLKNANDLYEKFSDALRKGKLEENYCKFICKKFCYGKEIEQKLHALYPRSQPEDLSLEFLCSRIKIMKELLIDHDKQLEYLWENVKSSKTKLYLRDMLVRTYLRKPALQAAIEVLLFDCMNLLKSKKPDLVHLWRKTNYLFNGINLRNVLAHGNPLFESVGKLLDPLDLPNEIITKSMELMGDLKAVESLCTLKEVVSDEPEKLVSFINSTEENRAFADLCEIVQKCTNWEHYAHLLLKKSHDERRNSTS